MPRYASTAAQHAAFIQSQTTRKVTPIIVALILAMAVLAYLILSATVGGGEPVAPRYHRHFA